MIGKWIMMFWYANALELRLSCTNPLLLCYQILGHKNYGFQSPLPSQYMINVWCVLVIQFVHTSLYTGPLFTKRMDVLPQDLVKTRSQKIQV